MRRSIEPYRYRGLCVGTPAFCEANHLHEPRHHAPLVVGRPHVDPAPDVESHQEASWLCRVQPATSARGWAGPRTPCHPRPGLIGSPRPLAARLTLAGEGGREILGGVWQILLAVSPRVARVGDGETMGGGTMETVGRGMTSGEVVILRAEIAHTFWNPIQASVDSPASLRPDRRSRSALAGCPLSSALSARTNLFQHPSGQHLRQVWPPYYVVAEWSTNRPRRRW
jgi:hypothetical protein